MLSTEQKKANLFFCRLWATKKCNQSKKYVGQLLMGGETVFFFLLYVQGKMKLQMQVFWLC